MDGFWLTMGAGQWFHVCKAGTSALLMAQALMVACCPLTGVAALRELYAVAGMGWAAKLGSFPVISNVVDLVYGLLSKYR